MAQLFFVNVPRDCSDDELKDWIKSHGVEPESIRIIRDLVSGASPAFAYASLKDASRIPEAISALNGRAMRNQVISVSCADRRRAIA